MPDLSAIIPVERGHQFLMAALDGFLGQSVKLADFEILVVSRERMRDQRAAKYRRLAIRMISWPRGGHLASAINAAAKAARGSIVAVIDPQWRPLPQLVDYCLQFHERETRESDVLSLATAIDPACADDPLLWWLHQHQLAGLDALSPGIHGWRGLRFDAVCLKRALLRAHPIPNAEGDETLMRAKWVTRTPVRVFAEPVPVLATAAPADLGIVLAREYRSAHARLAAMRASGETFANESIDDRFQHPDRYVLSSSDQTELVSAITDATRTLAGTRPHFAVGAAAEQLELLGKLYLVAVSHARSTGWRDAKTGKPLSAGEARCLRLGALVSSPSLER